MKRNSRKTKGKQGKVLCRCPLDCLEMWSKGRPFGTTKLFFPYCCKHSSFQDPTILTFCILLPFFLADRILHTLFSIFKSQPMPPLFFHLMLANSYYLFSFFISGSMRHSIYVNKIISKSLIFCRNNINLHS